MHEHIYTTEASHEYKQIHIKVENMRFLNDYY